MWKKKGAYFFVLDAFIAGLVIISTLAISLSSSSIQDDPLQGSLLAQDFLTYLEQTSLANYGGEIVYDMLAQGVLTDTSISILEQIVLLNASGTQEAKNNITALLAEVTSLAPEQFGIGYYLTTSSASGELYSYALSGKSQDSARLLLSAQRIVTLRTTDVQLAIFEVRVWQ